MTMAKSDMTLNISNLSNIDGSSNSSQNNNNSKLCVASKIHQASEWRKNDKSSERTMKKSYQPSRQAIYIYTHIYYCTYICKCLCVIITFTLLLANIYLISSSFWLFTFLFFALNWISSFSLLRKRKFHLILARDWDIIEFLEQFCSSKGKRVSKLMSCIPGFQFSLA